MRRTVTRGFHNTLKSNYPWLDEKAAYWKFTRHLLFGHKDGITWEPVCSQYAIAKATDQIAQLDQRNFNGVKFLNEFQSKMGADNFYWEDWCFIDKRARQAVVRWSPAVQDALADEYYNYGSDRVYMETGKKVSRAMDKQYNDSELSQAHLRRPVAHEESLELLDYLNALPSNKFTKVVNQNFQDVWQMIPDIKDEAKRIHQANILLSIYDNPKPLYQPSCNGNTVRLFPCEQSMLMLNSRLRKVLCKGWTELDLRSSQLAICAYLWDVPEVIEFLRSGCSIWTELMGYLGFESDLKQKDEFMYSEVKKAIKKPLYAIVFGMSKENVINEMNGMMGAIGIDDNLGQKFLEHEIVNAMRKRRDKRMQEIHRAGFVYTCFNKPIKVTNTGKFKTSNIPSILAEQAQALEFKLLMPVIELAKSTDDFDIVLWQHDGYSVSFRNPTKKDRWINRMKEAVLEQAMRLNLLTELEVNTLI